MDSLLKNNKRQLVSINDDLPKNIENIITFIKENDKDTSISSLKSQIEEYKRLQISKDNEIAKLNDINTSKQNEIERYKKIIEEQKNGSREKQIEEENKKEREKLITKINDLELKIYNINDEKSNLTKENKKLQTQIDEKKKKKEKTKRGKKK